ncbi:hypothetical protein ABZ805_28375 [Saccharopolyspora sp. NPDC047091]|uniref:hypothetical protein n=1 Tax=Saccharopolyspora sp. NPDC047091 TaxID=3155924 RepID=UPI0033FE55C0
MLVDALFTVLGVDLRCTSETLWVVVPLGIGLRVKLTRVERRHLELSELLAERNGTPVFVRREHGIRIALPWHTARALYKPRQPADRWTRNFERIAFWRSAAGLLTVAVATASYESPTTPLFESIGKTQLTALLALCVAPPLLALLVCVTRERHRGRLRDGITSMLRRILFGVLTAAVPVAAIIGVIVLLYRFSDDGRLTEAWMVVALFIPFLAVCWLAGYALCSTYWAARTAFWTSDVHPLLPPVISAALAVVTTALDIAERVGSTDPRTPAPIWYVLTVSGLVTTLVLAIVEYRRLRGTGIGWRTGPSPVEADTVPIPMAENPTTPIPRCTGRSNPLGRGAADRDATVRIPRPRRPGPGIH